MPLSLKHLAASNPENLHFSFDEADKANSEAEVRRMAKALKYHFAFLNGADVRDGKELQRKLGTLYAFPGAESGANVRPNWDGTRDWMGDLTWLTGWPPGSSGIRGFILYYRTPGALFNAYPVEFGHLLKTIDDSREEHAEYGIALHMVSMPISDRLETFLTMSRIYPRVCKECLYGERRIKNQVT